MELWLDGPLTGTEEFCPERVWLGANGEESGDGDGIVEVQVGDGEDQTKAREMIGLCRWLVVRCKSWRMIPFENLIAAACGSGTKICAHVTEVSDLRGLAFALSKGVDGLLLGNDAALWKAAESLAVERAERERASGQGGTGLQGSSTVSFFEAPVMSVTDGGVGERVCVDLTKRLNDDEGILVGSSASALCLVIGETLKTSHVPARPFRVNAGPVHSYVLLSNGKTKYLCELDAGDRVAIFDTKGKSRGEATVGRLKIERRPFLLVRFTFEVDRVDREKERNRGSFSEDANGDSERGLVQIHGVPDQQVKKKGQEEAQIFLQQAETVRLAAITPESRGGDRNGASESSAKPSQPESRDSENGNVNLHASPLAVTELQKLLHSGEGASMPVSLLIRRSGGARHVGMSFSGTMKEK